MPRDKVRVQGKTKCPGRSGAVSKQENIPGKRMVPRIKEKAQGGKNPS
jgi:hypothetical protein